MPVQTSKDWVFSSEFVQEYVVYKFIKKTGHSINFFHVERVDLGRNKTQFIYLVTPFLCIFSGGEPMISNGTFSTRAGKICEKNILNIIWLIKQLKNIFKKHKVIIQFVKSFSKKLQKH